MTQSAKLLCGIYMNRLVQKLTSAHDRVKKCNNHQISQAQEVVPNLFVLD